MNLTLVKLFQWAKTLHRTALFGMVILSLLMGATGSIMRFPVTADRLLNPNFQLVRSLHSQLSPYFSIFLILMMVSGLYMYFFPWYTKRQASKKQKTS
jgi:uncharacterized iron-regulated membrane protein